MPTYQFSTPDGHEWEAESDHDLDDDELATLSEHVKTATPEPMKGPSMVERAMAAPGRAVDYALGTAGAAIGHVMQTEPVRAYSRMFEGIPGAAKPEDIDRATTQMEDLREGKTTPGHIIASAIPEGEGALGHAAGVARAVVETGGDMGRDPLALGAIGALRKLGVAGKALTAGASAMFAIQAGKSVTPQLLEAQRMYEEDKGWTPRVTEQVAKAVLTTGAATMAAVHTPRAVAETVASALPDRGGEVYSADQSATPDQRAAAETAQTARATREAEIQAGHVKGIETAGKRLLFERSAALEPQHGATVPEPEAGTPAATALDKAQAAAVEQLATPSGPREADIRRYTKGENVGQPDISPAQSSMVRQRLLQLWADEGGPATRTKPAEGPEPQTQGIVQPWYERLGRQFVRTIEPAFQATARLPVVGKELAGRQREYVTDWEKLKGEADSGSIRALQSVGLDVRNPKAMAENPLSGQIQAFVDGRAPLEALPPEARAAAESLRQIGLKMAQAKVEAGILKPEDVLEHHWPRQSNTPEAHTLMEKARQYARDNGGTVEDALAELQRAGSQIQGVRTSRKVGSSEARATGAEALTPDQYRTDWGAWFDDIRESSREVAEARHLGKNGQTALDLANKLNAIPADRDFALTLLDRLRGTEPQGRGHKFSSNLRATQAGLGLVTSPLTQFGTLSNTAAETSTMATVKSIADTFTKPVMGPDGKPMRWNQPVKRLRAALNEARLDSMRQGALNAGVAEGLTDYYTKTNTQAGPKGTGYAGKVGRLWHVRGTGWADGLQRVIAAKTAPHIVPDAWAAAKSGNKLAQRTLDNWHVDWRRADLTPEMIDTAARRISERSQFKVGVGDVPLWASSPWGKVAFQFQSFGYAHTQFVGSAIDEARQGNVKPLAKLLTLGAATGYLTNEAKQAIFGGRDPKRLDEEAFGAQVADAFGHGGHYSTEGARGKALAYIEGLGAAGGVGALSGAYDRLASGDPSKILLGASGADVDALARAGKELSEGNIGKAAGRTVQGMLPVGPLGVNPRELVGEALTDKPISNPGYAGRELDAVRGEAGAQHRQARADQGALEREGKLQKMANDEAGTMITAAPQKPIDERLVAARRATVMAQLKAELIRAIRRGASEDELGAIREKYMARAGEDEKPVKMGWRAEDRLRGRVVPLEEEEAAQ